MKIQLSNHFLGLGIVTGLKLYTVIIPFSAIELSFQFAFPWRLSTAEVVARKWLLRTITNTPRFL